jgi:tetratricopeptide (TPR) repeat protein
MTTVNALPTNPVFLHQAGLTQLVNTAFKNYHSILSLSRSPLANSPLVEPALVLDNVSPTADERGRALRLVLQWAVEQLAPGPVRYPLGTYRPLDDPTWRNPLWWRYNILRHRYLDPLHPDDFVEGGRFTETLMALTGIPSADTFFDERNRAIREVAQHLWQQKNQGEANEILRRLALEAAYRPLQKRPAALQLLGVAATLMDVFPRSLLMELAHAEQLPEPESILSQLTARRLLLMSEDGDDLWMSSVLRTYVYARQDQDKRRRRHRHAAQYFERTGDPLRAAIHWQHAAQWSRAAAGLFRAADDLINELQIPELRDALAAFEEEHLPPHLWWEVQLRLSDLYAQLGQQDEALAACRRALQAMQEPDKQARVYRRMGKLYEKHNQRHALTYYQQAMESFLPDDPELLVLLKDRGWLYILRHEWAKAETDLFQALAQSSNAELGVRADIYDALAALHRYQKRFDEALEYARRALALREEMGDTLRTAKSFGNLGLLYRAMGETAHAIAAYKEAMSTYAKLGNQELMAMAQLNIGTAYHLAGRIQEAIAVYRQSLTLCQRVGLPLAEARLHSNLAEAYAETGQVEAARRHWHMGYTLSRRSEFDDQIDYFLKLAATHPALQDLVQDDLTSTAGLKPQPDDASPKLRLHPVEQMAMDLAAQAGRVTPRDLMAASALSKATATRRLASLVERGLLEKHGKGRGTYYTTTRRDEDSSVGTDDLSQQFNTLRERIKEHRLGLMENYGILRLGLMESEKQQSRTSPRLVVDFEKLPDLVRFFDIENRLNALFQMDADLKLLDALPEGDTRNISWLW